MWQPEPKVPFKWVKLRSHKHWGNCHTYGIEWGERNSREYIYLRGGLTWKRPKNQDDPAVAEGIRVDGIGMVRYPVQSRNAYWLEREYHYCSEGKDRLFPCSLPDYVGYTRKGIEARKRANKYLNFLMNQFSERIEKATRRPVVRRKLKVGGEFTYPFAQDEVK